MKNERDLDLRSLWFHVLRDWRMLLIASILVAAAMGFFGYRSGVGAMNGLGGEDSYKSRMEAYETAKDGVGQELVAVKENIEKHMAYQESSYIMSINPYEVHRATAAYQVQYENMEESGWKDKRTAILAAYQSSISGKGLRPEDIGLSDKYTESLNALINVSYDANLGTLNLSASGASDEDAEAMISKLYSYIDNETEVIKKRYPGYKIERISEGMYRGYDNSIFSKGTEQINALKTLQEAARDLQSRLDSFQEKAPRADSITPGSQMTKMAVLGFIVGAMLGSLLSMAGYLLLNRVESSSELEERTGLRVLGDISNVREKRLFGGVDRIINRMQDGEHTGGEDISLLAASLRALSKNGGIVLTLPYRDESLESTVEKLKESIDSENVTIVYDALRGVDDIERLGEGDSRVVLLLNKGKTGYASLKSLLELLESLGKEPTGVVLLS